MRTMYRDPIKEVLDAIFDNKSFYERNDKPSDISKNGEDYRIHVLVPGISKEDIKISVKDNILTISYEKTEDKKHSFVNSFKKVYSLPEDGDEKNITGKVENGVVEIVIPKSKKKSVERFISLN